MGEPTEVVLKALDRFNAGDVEGFVDMHAPGAEMHDVPEVPGSTVYHGQDGIRKWAETVLEAIDGLQFDQSDSAENGEFVAVVTRAHGKGRESGIAVDWTISAVWGVRDGLIYYHHGYAEHADALEALEAPRDKPS